MTRLAPLDLGIVAAYLLGMALVGAWFARSQKDLRAYFVGGRSAGWFLVLMSIVATETSAVTFLSVPGLGYREGGDLTFLQLALGYIVGRCLIAWFLLPQYMEGNLFSAYEVLRNRFSPAVQRVASGLFLLTRTLADGLRLYLTALLLQYVGFDIPTAIVVLGVVTVGYTLFGGMKAVLWTDLVQFSIKIAGAGLAGWYVVQLLPGGWGQLCEIGGEAGKFRAVDWKFDPASDANIWAGLVGGAVFSMASHGADQLMVQRYLCARSLGHARAALVLSGFVVFAQFVLFLLVGVGIYALRTTGAFDPGSARPDEVFGRFIVTALPTGAIGLLVAAVLAAAMSTLSSSLNSSANALVTDFYRPLRPGHSQGWYVGVSRTATAGWGMAQVGVAFAAYHFGGDDSVVKRVMAVAGLTTGLLLGLFVLGSLPRPAPSWAALVGLCTAAATVLAVWVPPALGLTTAWLGWPWYAPLGAGTTVGVALLAAALGRPASPTVAMTIQRFV